MATQDYSGLLSGVITPQEQLAADQQRGIDLANLQPGRAGLALSPGRSRRVTEGLGRILGIDTRNPQEQVQEQVFQLLQAGQVEQAAQILQQVGDTEGALKLLASAKNQQSQQTNLRFQRDAAVAAIRSSNLPQAQQDALIRIAMSSEEIDFTDLLDRAGIGVGEGDEATLVEPLTLERSAALWEMFQADPVFNDILGEGLFNLKEGGIPAKEIVLKDFNDYQQVILSTGRRLTDTQTLTQLINLYRQARQQGVNPSQFVQSRLAAMTGAADPLGGANINQESLGNPINATPPLTPQQRQDRDRLNANSNPMSQYFARGLNKLSE
jgi:hypothetical protein